MNRFRRTSGGTGFLRRVFLASMPLLLIQIAPLLSLTQRIITTILMFCQDKLDSRTSAVSIKYVSFLLSLFVSIIDIFIQESFEFLMVLIIGSTNDEFLDMGELTLDRIEP